MLHLCLYLPVEGASFGTVASGELPPTTPKISSTVPPLYPSSKSPNAGPAKEEQRQNDDAVLKTVVGIIIGIVGTILLIVVGLALYKRYRKQRSTSYSPPTIIIEPRDPPSGVSMDRLSHEDYGAVKTENKTTVSGDSNRKNGSVKEPSYVTLVREPENTKEGGGLKESQLQKENDDTIVTRSRNEIGDTIVTESQNEEESGGAKLIESQNEEIYDAKVESQNESAQVIKSHNESGDHGDAIAMESQNVEESGGAKVESQNESGGVKVIKSHNEKSDDSKITESQNEESDAKVLSENEEESDVLVTQSQNEEESGPCDTISQNDEQSSKITLSQIEEECGDTKVTESQTLEEISNGGYVKEIGLEIYMV
ncbi:uncharacterized protein [Amphiura filiformis]|uniref:uncharacterized protein n=1 Tax=Amphiura filiformis TaxID=82378 RepID=UPI003B222D60